MSYFIRILLLFVLSLNVAMALNPPPPGAWRDYYSYYKKDGKYYGAENGMATLDKHYESPTGEEMYYCQNPQGEPDKRGRQCCGRVLDGVRQVFVCTSRSCDDGEFQYLDRSERVVATSLKPSEYADPHRQYEAHLTRLRVCRD